MLRINTFYEGRQYTVDLHDLIIENTYAHKLGREDLYKALVKLKCPDIEKHHGHQDLSFRYGVWLQKRIAETVK